MNHGDKNHVQKLTGLVLCGIGVVTLIFAIVYYFNIKPDTNWVLTNILGNLAITMVIGLTIFPEKQGTPLTKFARMLQMVIIIAVATISIYDDYNTVISLLLLGVAAFLSYCYVEIVQCNLRKTVAIFIGYLDVNVFIAALLQDNYTNAIQNAVAILFLSWVSYLICLRQLKRHEAEKKALKNAIDPADIETAIKEIEANSNADVSLHLKLLKEKVASARDAISYVRDIDELLK
jgi:hypothetical protein